MVRKIILSSNYKTKMYLVLNDKTSSLLDAEASLCPTPVNKSVSKEASMFFCFFYTRFFPNASV